MKRRMNPLTECPHCHVKVIPTDAGICPSCYKPITRRPAIHAPESESTPSTVALWTPRQIAILSLLPGIPGGIVMSSINWIKIGLARKAVAHMAGGAVAYCIYLVIFSFISNYFGVVFALAFQLGAVYYLYHGMKKDIEEFRIGRGKVQTAGWVSGLLICLATDAILIALNVYFLLALGLIRIPK
jgi:hypothetical protein